jgi:type IX secretion system PorP/SprF family membrane protein
MQLNAQDLHFSQFNENPSLINPALTGSSGVFRASANYRDQWRNATTPYKTYGVSVESKFKTSNWDKVEGKSMTFANNSFSRFAGGLSFYSDKAGDGNMSFTQLNASLATFVAISKSSNLSFGVQGSVAQRKIDYSKLVFSNQYNGIGYDANIVNGENLAFQSFIYPDIAAGLNWSYSSKENVINSNKQVKANMGVAFYHINQPKSSYLAGGNDKLKLKYVFHGNFLFCFANSNIGIAPSYLFQFQGKSKELIAGTLIKYYMKEDSKYTGIILRSSINLGLFYRYQDAAIVSLSYDIKQKYSIGISYDLNVSGLSKTTKYSGGPEIVLKFNSGNAYLYQKKPRG